MYPLCTAEETEAEVWGGMGEGVKVDPEGIHCLFSSIPKLHQAAQPQGTGCLGVLPSPLTRALLGEASPYAECMHQRFRLWFNRHPLHSPPTLPLQMRVQLYFWNS